ncbi:MAG: DNA-directed RNA polymerase subunit D [Candidatus Bilamarchaeaceae archaeon]
MNISLIKKHENRIEFSVKDISPYFANLIRRYAMARVPVLAIDKIIVYENTSAFWDEYIAHRIGLMPVVTPEKLPKNTEISFYLEFEGPGVAYSKDLKCTDADIRIAKDNIPIITLNEKQRIKLEGKTVLGRGTRHAKFQAGLVSYGIKDTGEYNFFVESFYQMEPAEVILRGCEEALTEIEELKKGLKAKD